jgi:hypothetical protein
MDNFKDLLRKRFSQQYRGKNIIWSIAINELKKYFNIKEIDPEIEKEIITWYVKQEKLFIKTTDQNLKIQIFKDKFDIINKINEKLDEVGYKSKINYIILK